MHGLFHGVQYAQEGEIELEIDELSQQTHWKLDSYVNGMLQFVSSQLFPTSNNMHTLLTRVPFAESYFGMSRTREV